MKLHVGLESSIGTVTLLGSTVLQWDDIGQDPAKRALWRSARIGEIAHAPDGPELGIPSAMGYWIRPANPVAIEAASRTLTVVDPEKAAALPALRQAPGGRPAQTVRVKAPNKDDGELVLTIGPSRAQVVATPAAWAAIGDAVLLAVSQYWRYTQVDAEIDRLTEEAHRDLDHSNMPGPGTLRAHGRVVASARAVRALLLDLPHFSGPLSDPLAYLPGERSAQLYETLAEKLRLEEWCERLDDRAEAIEDAYEALTEKLFEYKNFAWEAALETVIIVILLLELAVLVYETLSP